MKRVLPVLVHLSPLIPLYYDRRALAGALLLFVLLCYIKVFKLKQMLADQVAKGGNPREEASIQGALKRWRALTFLAESP